MDFLPTLWFAVIAFFWGGYLLLEGFDLGVGMLMRAFARTESERRVLLNTIGPVWDGNEVWLITAGAATFAAFPHWYASLFSALYLPLVFVLLALILRAVAFEYRGKAHRARTRAVWDWCIALGSLVVAFGVGALLALTTTGLPLNANGDRVGGPMSWFSWYAVLGGLGVVAFSLVHALAFVGLKTDGGVRERAGRALRRWGWLGFAPLTAWVLAVGLRSGNTASWLLTGLAVAGALAGTGAARARREGPAFAGGAAFVLAGSAAVFTAAYPVVLPSTLDPAFALTVANSAVAPYTLGFMSVVAAFGVPLVLAYQAWTYWVFRRRLSERHIPAPHAVVPVVGR